MTIYFRRFGEIPTYSDAGSQNQVCRDLLPKGLVPRLVVGYDSIEGPGHNGVNRHAGWHQVFFVLQGRGLLFLGDRGIQLEAPCIVTIPANTDHDVQVAPGERIEYVYINEDVGEERQSGSVGPGVRLRTVARHLLTIGIGQRSDHACVRLNRKDVPPCLAM